jgi:preprotein translocase subunit SecA
MVTKAIERAQNTVEQRNAEIRKNLLKYDEVRNEQRKVIYARRMQIIDGDDLREETLQILESALSDVVENNCATDYNEEWDIDGLLAEARTYYPTQFTADELRQAATKDELAESLVAEALAYYERREQALPGGTDTMREMEREIMLRIIDTRWREHLAEMDYLYEGIHLRAMGQKDPLVEWQREGFEMFGNLMDSIDDDYVKYVMHAEVVVEEPVPSLDRAQYVSADEPVQGTSGMRQAAAAAAVAAGDQQAAAMQQQEEEEIVNVPLVKSAEEKIGRNQPCYCGSGKKYKMCHGR